MFKSTKRSIVFPQSEHLRLVGALAYHWGNVHFDLPPVGRAVLTAGMAFHDRAYGYLDNHAIGEISEQDWLGIARCGFFEMSFSDPAADIIARMHILRLVGSRPVSSAPELRKEMEQALEDQIAQAGYSRELFQRIDRITEFTDRISFDFCSERQSEGRLGVFARNDSDEEVDLSYRIDGETITLDPWPLDVGEVTGYLNAFRATGYPQTLDPVIAPYRILAD